jgi:hypothetical protein
VPWLLRYVDPVPAECSNFLTVVHLNYEMRLNLGLEVSIGPDKRRNRRGRGFWPA